MGEKPKKLRCAYKYCRHQTHEITPGEEVERSGKLYHEDCLHEMEVIEQIIDYFYRKVNSKVVFWQLRKVLNRLIYEEGFEAEYVLFAVRRWVSQGRQLTYPAGIAYVVQNKGIANEYDRMMTQKKKAEIDLSSGAKELEFLHKPVKDKTINDIFN